MAALLVPSKRGEGIMEGGRGEAAETLAPDPGARPQPSFHSLPPPRHSVEEGLQRTQEITGGGGSVTFFHGG